MHQMQIGRAAIVSPRLSGQSLDSSGEWESGCKRTEAQNPESSVALPTNFLNNFLWMSLILLLASVDFSHLSTTFQTHRLKHINYHPEPFPCDDGPCKWGLISVGQQGLSSLFEDYSSLSSGLAQTLATLFLIHHCRLLIAPTASPY